MLEDNPRLLAISACGGSTGQLLHVWPCLLLAQVSRPRQTPGTYSRSGCLIGSHEFLSFSPKPRGAAAAQSFGKNHLAKAPSFAAVWADTVWLVSISGSQCCTLSPPPPEKQRPKTGTVIERYSNELWLSEKQKWHWLLGLWPSISAFLVSSALQRETETLSMVLKVTNAVCGLLCKVFI